MRWRVFNTIPGARISAAWSHYSATAADRKQAQVWAQRLPGLSTLTKTTHHHDHILYTCTQLHAISSPPWLFPHSEQSDCHLTTSSIFPGALSVRAHRCVHPRYSLCRSDQSWWAGVSARLLLLWKQSGQPKPHLPAPVFVGIVGRDTRGGGVLKPQLI